MNPRIGSLFSGYGGLDLGVRAVLGGSVAWHVENEPAAAKVLARHWPNVPNYGDVTAVEWPEVEPVDVLTGGFPCQDVSAAGKRAGLMPDSRSGLWAHMARAVHVVRPRLVIVENVKGLLSAEAYCDLEPCPWCVGDGRGRPLRALGAVLGDLAVLGYDALWCGLRAADVGAPHARFRVFIAAVDAASIGSESCGTDGNEPLRANRASGTGQLAATDTSRVEPGRRRIARKLASPQRPTWARHRDTAFDGARASVAGDADGATRDQRRQSTASQTPGGGTSTDARRSDRALVAAEWGAFAPAVERWSTILGRSVPDATRTGRRGGQQLAPEFVEWLMGLDAGHVTGVDGLTRNDMLRLLGNGVVPQQAAEAVRYLVEQIDAEVIAR